MVSSLCVVTSQHSLMGLEQRDVHRCQIGDQQNPMLRSYSGFGYCTGEAWMNTIVIIHCYHIVIINTTAETTSESNHIIFSADVVKFWTKTALASLDHSLWCSKNKKQVYSADLNPPRITMCSTLFNHLTLWTELTNLSAGFEGRKHGKKKKTQSVFETTKCIVTPLPKNPALIRQEVAHKKCEIIKLRMVILIW
jgi:hypothetical protein